jgi:hypothetical protein
MFRLLRSQSLIATRDRRRRFFEVFRISLTRPALLNPQ